MYKTIRHGENSLQYTILPQNDDFRIEGKLTSAESKCSRRFKSKRPKRRSFFAYLGLIFVCTVIVGAAVVPFLVSSEFLPNPTEWFLKTKAALSKSLISDSKTTNKDQQKNIDNFSDAIKSAQVIKNYKNGYDNSKEKHSDISSKALINNSHPVSNDNIRNIFTIAKPNITIQITTSENGKKTFISNNDDQMFQSMEDPNRMEKNHVSKEKNMLGATVKTDHVVAEIRFKSLDDFSNITPTIVVTTTRSQVVDIEKDTTTLPSNHKLEINTKVKDTSTTRPAISIITTTNFNAPRAPINMSNNQNTSYTSTTSINTRIMQVPLLKSTKGRPSKPNTISEKRPNEGMKDSHNNTDIGIADSKLSNVWFTSNWPYMDPSTIFQWTGYTDENSVLLPALLGFALIGIILIITVCIVARKKKIIVSSVRKRNRNDLEDSGQDANATLLTASNLSDEE